MCAPVIVNREVTNLQFADITLEFFPHDHVEQYDEEAAYESDDSEEFENDEELTEEDIRNFNREFDEQSDDEYYQAEREHYATMEGIYADDNEEIESL